MRTREALVNRDMLEAAKRLIQLGRGEEVEGVDAKVEEGQDKKQKRRSLVDLVMSPSRIFTAEKQFGERAEEDSDSREPEIGVRKFTPHSTGRRRRRSLEEDESLRFCDLECRSDFFKGKSADS